jgi:hypothetical protein
LQRTSARHALRMSAPSARGPKPLNRRPLGAEISTMDITWCAGCPSWPAFWITFTLLLVAAVGALLIFRALRGRARGVAWLGSLPLLIIALALAYAAYQQLLGDGWHGRLLR